MPSRLLLRILAFTLTAATVPAFAATPTTTTLAVSGSGSVAAGTVVTLTATTTANGVAVNPGQVKFCDITPVAAVNPTCTFLHVLTTAQLTTAGVATYKFIPGIGSHIYQAIFIGKPGVSPAVSASTSATSALVVTGTNSITTIAQSGTQGNYTLTGTVTGTRPSFPTGTVSFQDTSNANAVVGSASLVAGTSTTTFTTKSTPAASFAGGSVVADFNGDGILDLAILSPSANALTILKGNGDGTFTALASPTFSSTPGYIVVGDFNGDGILDLAVTITSNSGGVGTVAILKGNGDGTFTALASPSTGTFPGLIAVGDFNGDGILDLAVPTYVASGGAGSLTILKGNGDGTFTALASLATGTYPAGVVTADFNGDGIPDLAVGSGGNALAIFKGKGDGTFTALASPSAGYEPTFLIVGDFNGDGIADIAVSDRNSNSDVILKGNGDGTFTAFPSITTGSATYSMSIGDFNGDGIPDLALVLSNGSSPGLSVYKGNGDGTFTLLASPTLATNPGFVAAGDFNGDGIPDLQLSTGNTATILLTSAGATATATQTGIAAGSPGTHAVRASFPGDANYSASTSATTALAGPDATTTTVTSVNPASSTVGNNFSVTVTVVDSTNATVAPTGSIVISTTVNGATHQLAIYNGITGGVTAQLSAVYAGANTITATFTPGQAGSFAASADATGKPFTVAPATPVQYNGTNDQTVQQAVATTLTIIIAFPGFGTPTGAITVKANGNAIAGLGTPTCVNKYMHTNCAYPYTPALAPGAYTLTYTQAADANYNASTGTSTLTVTGAPTVKPRTPIAAPVLFQKSVQ